MTIRSAVVGVLLAVVAVGCSSGSKSNTSGTTAPTVAATTTTAPAATTTTAPAVTTTNQALAAKAMGALPEPSDFAGTAFKQQPDGGGDCPASANQCSSLDIEKVWGAILTCLGVTDSPQLVETSATYLENLATQARASVEYTSQPSVAAIEAAFAGAKFNGCVTSSFNADAKRSAPSGSTPGPSTATAETPPAVGQKASATRITVTIDMQGLKINLFQDFVVVFNGTTISRFFFLNPGSPFAPALESSLIKKVVANA